MVAIRSSRSPLRQRKRLIQVLEKAAEDLEHLHREAARLAATANDRRREQLSPSALQAIERLARCGRHAVLARIADLVPRSPAETGSPPAAPRSGAQPASLLRWTDAAHFMGIFRRCGRRLCLALCASREAADLQTADVAFHLLHDLERQLWLLEGNRGRSPVAETAGGLLQAC